MRGRVLGNWREMTFFAKAWRLVALGLLPVVVWLAAPLFYSTRVDEAFPAVATAPTAEMIAPAPTVDAMAADTMAEPTVEAMAADTMAEPTAGAMAADTMAEPTVEAMAADTMAEPTAAVAEPVVAEPVALSTGMFTRVDALHAAEGSATIFRLPDGTRVLRLEPFKSQNGPDLYIGLSGHAIPRSNDELHQNGYTELARLKASEGNQNYELPADLDLSTIKSVVIYCRAFSVVFSTAELVQSAS